MGSLVDLNDQEIEELIILSIATNPWAQVVIFCDTPLGLPFLTEKYLHARLRCPVSTKFASFILHSHHSFFSLPSF